MWNCRCNLWHQTQWPVGKTFETLALSLFFVCFLCKVHDILCVVCSLVSPLRICYINTVSLNLVFLCVFRKLLGM